MGQKSPGFDSPLPSAADGVEATRTYLNQVAPSPAGPAHAPTETLPHPPTEIAAPAASPGAAPPGQNQDIVRYGPGVPDSPSPGQAELTAERAWHGTGQDRPSGRRRGRRLASAVLTIALIAASAVVLYVRFHHPPFQVTAVKITHQAGNGCTVNVTGQISTNGSTGTVSYQWLFPSGQQSPRPQTQPVAAGQDAMYVTVALKGSGHGSASQEVILQVLGPDFRAGSAIVVISC